MNDTTQQAPPPVSSTTPVDLNRRTQLKVVGWITVISILSIVGMLSNSPTWPVTCGAVIVAVMVIVVCGVVMQKH